MGFVMLAVFTIAEILLTVLTCTKFRSIRHKNRMIFTAGELALLMLVIFLPMGQSWRFTGCVIVLGIRLVISVIVFLVKRKREVKEKSNAKLIVRTVFGVVLIGSALFPAYIFSGYHGLKTTGSFKVKETEAILIDKSRLEPRENDGSNREIPIHFYYPEGGAENCPLVLFAHGSFGYYQSNSSLYFELASNGYVVASIDHPYYAFFTKDTSGKTIIVDFEFVQTAVNMQNSDDYTMSEEDYNTTREWMTLRTADENFVLDAIKAAKTSGSLDDAWYTKFDKINAEILNVLAMTDTENIGVTGHSIGGAAAVQLGRERSDVRAVIDIDGTMLGEEIAYNNGVIEYNAEPYPVPVLSLDNARHWKSYAGENGTTYVNTYLLNNALDAREAHFDGTEHMDFTDLPLFAPPLAKMLGKGDVKSSEFIPELNGIVLNFFDYYLKGEGTPTVQPWDGQTP
ncbi:MAG: hypothetical protein K2J77_06055 [Oscillospiraceae bacterium]|nr:hypothetical protein [Oscillospiraceae bacterium]